MQKAVESKHITINEQGPGLPPEVANKALEPFTHPGDERNETHQGLGLSLYLNALIMRHLGGNMTFKSGASGGTRVQLQLPNKPE